MLPVEAVDVQLHACRARWVAAVQMENRALEAVTMRRIDELLDQRNAFTGRRALEP